LPGSPLPPKIQTQSSANPRFEICEHLRRLAEAEVAALSVDIGLAGLIAPRLILDRALGDLIGVAVGDALGTTIEFSRARSKVGKLMASAVQKRVAEHSGRL
jgi:hypothetical protein